MEQMILSFRKELEEARARELNMEEQLHSLRMELARFQGSNSELATGLEVAQREKQSLQSSLDYVKTHSMVDWVDRAVETQVRGSAERIGNAHAAAIDAYTASVHPSSHMFPPMPPAFFHHSMS